MFGQFAARQTPRVGRIGLLLKCPAQYIDDVGADGVFFGPGVVSRDSGGMPMVRGLWCAAIDGSGIVSHFRVETSRQAQHNLGIIFDRT